MPETAAATPSLVTFAPSPSAIRAGVPVLPVLRAALFLLVIANLGRIPVAATGGRELPILANDVVTAVLLGLGAVAFLQRGTFHLDRVAVLALLFAAVGAVSASLAIPRFGLSVGAVLVSLAYLARWLFYLAIYVVVVNVARARDVDGIWAALETSILLFSAFGIVQSIFLPDFAQMVYPESRLYLDWDPQGHRLVSTFLDPNYASAFILIGLLVGLGKLAMGAEVRAWKLGMLLVALLLTASRGGLLAFMFGGATIFLVRGLSKRVMQAAAAGVLAVAAASPWLIEFARNFNKLELDASALSRLVDWIQGLTVLVDNPILGIGFNTWGFIKDYYGFSTELGMHAASFGLTGGLLFVAVMTGVVGLALYLLMMATIIMRSRRVWRDPSIPPAHRGIALGGAAMVPTIVVHSLFTNSLFYPFLMEALWVLWALSFSMLRTGQDQARGDGPPAGPVVRATLAGPAGMGLADAGAIGGGGGEPPAGQPRSR